MKPFNIVIAGIGGQGTITLGDLISNAALLSGMNVKNCSLHGLAKRFGAVETHVRIGEPAYSALIMEGQADLIFALEPLEALRACKYASEKTTFILDKRIVIPITTHLEKKNYPTLDEIVRQLKIFSKNIIIVDASEDARKISGTPLSANTYVFGVALKKKLLPFDAKMAVSAIEKALPERHIELNKKVLAAGMAYKG